MNDDIEMINLGYIEVFLFIENHIICNKDILTDKIQIAYWSIHATRYRILVSNKPSTVWTPIMSYVEFFPTVIQLLMT